MDNKQEFQPPRHWMGIEELESAYWNSPEALEKRSQEFHDKPVETISAIDNLPESSIRRRDFLTIMGASMALGATACMRRPVNKIIPYVIQPESHVPGVPVEYASACSGCSTGCGTLVKTREGRPIKIDGNPEHPVNRGALCARGQAQILDLYDPDRLKGPHSRVRPGLLAEETTWTVADTTISKRLKDAANSKRLRIVTGQALGPTSSKLANDFAQAAGTKVIHFDPIGHEEILESQLRSYGTAVLPRYFFDKAEFILSLGADFLGSWVSSVEHAKDWAKNRKLDENKKKLSKLWVVESNMSLTGSNSDRRFSCLPGDEFKVAMAIAHELTGGSDPALSSYSPAAVESALSGRISAQDIRSMARELKSRSGKSLVVGGSLAAKSKDSLGLQLAINFINSALGNEGSTLDGAGDPDFREVGRNSEIENLLTEIKTGKVEAVIFYRANIVFQWGRGSEFADALKQVPFIVAISDRDDETAVHADFVLPDHHALENWGDTSSRRSVVTIRQPTISPMYDTRSFEDLLIQWSKALGFSGVSSQATWYDYLRESWRSGFYKKSGSERSFDSFWEESLRRGVVSLGGESPKPRALRSGSLAGVGALKASENSELVLALYANSSVHDGKGANNAWLQELPDAVSTITWDNFLNISPKLAQKMSLKNDDVVELRSQGGVVELPINVQPGLQENLVSAAIGYGRTRAGNVGNGAGQDVNKFVQFHDGLSIFAGGSAQIRKTGRRYRLARTQEHNYSENRPVINDITLAEYLSNPAAANETNPELRMKKVPTIWPVHQYNGYRWGMAIDLNSCTGCGACVIACQAENNIPVVGRDNVRMSREMHWIRLDRYYSGNPENPKVLFQPMLCQHCENAPCETVCPVLATVHDSEGTNTMIYNRCVGTRYCQNNCPYKVRRFNFFDHWKSYSGPMNMAWNPDVTVRTRGVMEKCTFCTQRVLDAKHKAKQNGGRVKDGEVLTACQQTCPTEAIVFGDMNDPGSTVSKWKKNDRQFHALENVNTRPVVTYLSKVRNSTSGGEG